MRRIGTSDAEPLYGVAATRAIERDMAARLPPFELMARAGDAVAQLTRAIAPHARRIWVACGPGNNGGDGLVAATHLLRHANRQGLSPQVVVTLCGDATRLPADAAQALSEALDAGIQLADAPPAAFDCVIDALLGLGAQRPPEGFLRDQLTHMHSAAAVVLSVDLPSGLRGDTGHYTGPAPAIGLGTRHTLSLLTIKPGLFTAAGRDLAGCVWFDDLGAESFPSPAPTARLHGGRPIARARAHAAHKGSQGDVVVIGGQGIEISGAGMTGAAILAARAALRTGAGRVYVGLLDGGSSPTGWDPVCPELMFRRIDTLFSASSLLEDATVVCGCGGGSAVAAWLTPLLTSCRRLVLDADALNALSRDEDLQTLTRQRARQGQITVITPHPLEAARLLGRDTSEVMADRLAAATALSKKLDVICVLKGSGSVVAVPHEVPFINATGNAALATAGTGDVLAGMLGTAIAGTRTSLETAFHSVVDAVYQHGKAADRWDPDLQGELSASRLADDLRRLR